MMSSATTTLPHLQESLRHCSLDIAIYLATQQDMKGEFPAKDCYGKAFAALLWSLHGQQFDLQRNRALQAIINEHISPLPPNYHFEFNRFALIQLTNQNPNLGEVNSFIGTERYVGTHVANWMLLRAFCRLHSLSPHHRVMGKAEIFLVRHWFSRDGLIEDQRGAYTMQYHAFCLSLLGEILHGPLKDDTTLSAWFRDSIERFSHLVLLGGQCNYLGRGSLQSFGYASACLAFAHAYRLFNVPEYLEKLDQIFTYLRSFQRGNGSIPLVLRRGTEGDPSKVDLANPEYSGWWSYNNFYDYLPFTGGILARAVQILKETTHSSCVEETETVSDSRHHPTIKVFRNEQYTAVTALPNQTVWASSLPIPFVTRTGEYPLPCYGGEQFLPSLYQRECLPLPILELSNGVKKVFADGQYRWLNNRTMEGCLEQFRHQRTFLFHDTGIEVRDHITWPRQASVSQVRAPRLLLREQDITQSTSHTVTTDILRVTGNGDLWKEPEPVFGPDGPLNAFCVGNVPSDYEQKSAFTCSLFFSFVNPQPQAVTTDSSRTKECIDAPLISIVITAYNAAPTLRASLNAALAQSYSNFEVVLVDDGSTDETRAICQAITDPRFHYIPKSRLGRSRALNEAIASAKGTFIAINDADDLSHPNRLELCQEAFKQNPDTVILGTNFWVTHSQLHSNKFSWPMERQEIEEKSLELSSIRMFRGNPLLHSSVMFPKQVWKTINGYDEELPICVDYDFFLRALSLGKVRYLPQRTVLQYKNVDSFFRTKSPGEYISTLRQIKRRARKEVQLPAWTHAYDLIPFYLYGKLVIHRISRGQALEGSSHPLMISGKP